MPAEQMRFDQTSPAEIFQCFHEPVSTAMELGKVLDPHHAEPSDIGHDLGFVIGQSMIGSADFALAGQVSAGLIPFSRSAFFRIALAGFDGRGRNLAVWTVENFGFGYSRPPRTEPEMAILLVALRVHRVRRR